MRRIIRKIVYSLLPSRRKVSVILIIALFAGLTSYYFIKKANADIAANTVNTSTVATATNRSDQRKVFWDSVDSLWWVFFNNGSSIAYSSSPDGSTWTSRGTTGVATNDFSVWYVSGTSTMYMTYLSGSVTTSVNAQKGALSSTAITWSGLTTLKSSKTLSLVNMSRDSAGNLWVVYLSVITLSSSYTIEEWKSNSADNTTAWTQEANVATTTVDSYGLPVIVPMTTAGNMYVLWGHSSSGTQIIEGALWNNGTSSFGSVATIDTLGNNNGVAGIVSAVSVATDVVHLIYQTCQDVACSQGNIKYAKYSSAAWNTPITLDSNTTNEAPTLGVNTSSSNDLYAFWIRANTIMYKKGVSPYASGNWDASPTNLVTTGTNHYLTAAYQDGNSNIPLIYTSGTSTPWNVQFYGKAVTAAGPTKIAISSPTFPSTFNAATCQAITVQLQNGSSTPTNPVATTVVQMTSGSGGATWYTDSGCSSGLGSNQISYSTSQNSQTVYVKDNTINSGTTIQATRVSGDTVTNDTGKTYTILLGPVCGASNANCSTVTVNPSSTNTGQNTTVTITLKDAGGNAISGVAASNIIIDTTSGKTTATADVYQPIAATNGSGQTTALINWKDIVNSPKTVVVTISIVSVVGADGVTGHSGTLDSQPTVTVTNASSQIQIQGGTTLQGGTKLGQ